MAVVFAEMHLADIHSGDWVGNNESTFLLGARWRLLEDHTLRTAGLNHSPPSQRTSRSPFPLINNPSAKSFHDTDPGRQNNVHRSAAQQMLCAAERAATRF